MKIVLATGIYPPEIGGPATYVKHLSEGLRRKGAEVRIIAYGESHSTDSAEGVTRVSRSGGPLVRHWRYAKVLRAQARTADIVEAFSSVSAGVPLWMAHLRHPKKVLRLGGDFLWERATDRGDMRSLSEWYRERPAFMGVMNGLLRTFDTIVFSTSFQEELYRRVYRNLPHTTVIENVSPPVHPTRHTPHEPFRLLFMGRFVAFKNIPALLQAVVTVPDVQLTLAGSGPLEQALRAQVYDLGLENRVLFLPPQQGDEKKKLLAEHDLLVLPSRTEISPHAALEARAAGLPVLLTEETGLSRMLLEGMVTVPLRTPDDIAAAITDVRARYDTLSAAAAETLPERSWDQLADEHLALFSHLL